MQRGVLADGFFQFSLLLLAAAGYGAALSTGWLDPWTASAAGLALLARGVTLGTGWRLPLSVWTSRALALACLGFYPLDLLYISNVPAATLRLLVALAAVNILAPSSGRDFFYVGGLALLELLAAAVLSTSLSFLGFLAAFLVLAVAARVSYEIHHSAGKSPHAVDPAPMAARLAGVSVALAVGIVALSAGLFLIVPRAAGAYFAKFPHAGEPLVGFSDEVSLGDVGRLNNGSAAVLRVKILEGGPRNGFLWRGSALQDFDGVRWSNPPSRTRTLNSGRGLYVWERLRRAPRAKIHYKATRSPMDTDALFLPGFPDAVAGDFRRLDLNAADSLSLPDGRWKTIRYEGWSYVETERPEELKALNSGAPYPERMRPYLHLPSIDPRIRELARFLTENQVTPYWRAAAIEHHLRTEYGYTLDLPQERSADPLADFLFRRRKGHCEYFASAMAVMLRSIQIPARVATGFQNGEYNPMSDSYTVRTSDAHAWVEAYIAGWGWVTFDPTPSAPADRAGLARQARLVLDAVETYWSDWVVQYDFVQQAALARSARDYWYNGAYRLALDLDGVWQGLRNTKQPLQALWGVLAAAGAVALLWGARRLWPRLAAAGAARRVVRGRGNVHDCAVLYGRAIRALERRGFVRQPWQTPVEFVRIVTPQERQDSFHQVTEAYYRARFGADPESARRLPELVRALESLG